MHVITLQEKTTLLKTVGRKVDVFTDSHLLMFKQQAIINYKCYVL